MTASDTRTPLEAARDFAGRVERLPREALELDARLEALEALRPAARELLDSLDSAYGRAQPPLSAFEREALQLARRIAEGLAAAWRLAAEEIARERLAVRARRALAPPLLRAMQYAAAALRASYRSYSRVPAGSWKRLHGIYLLAEQEGVAMGAADPVAKTSVAEAYCESLLLALVDPYRLQPGEVDRIASLVRALRAPVTLGKEPPASPAGGHFLVPCDLDQPPRSALAAAEDAGGPNWRFLDTNPLVETLREVRRLMRTGDEPEGAAPLLRGDGDALLARLIGFWDDPPQRAFRRDPAEGSVAICVGVQPIARFVAHDTGSDEEAGAQAAALRDRLTMPLRALPEDESGHLIPIHEWDIVDLSRGGLKVRRRASTEHPVAVGEAVGIRTPGRHAWTVGATRWVATLEDGTTEFGVQSFAEAVCAVWVKHASPSIPHQLGILVTAGEDGTEELLLAPPGTWSAGARYELRGEGFRSRVQAGDLLEGNACFELFRIEPT